MPTVYVFLCTFTIIQECTVQRLCMTGILGHRSNIVSLYAYDRCLHFVVCTMNSLDCSCPRPWLPLRLLSRNHITLGVSASFHPHGVILFLSLPYLSSQSTFLTASEAFIVLTSVSHKNRSIVVYVYRQHHCFVIYFYHKHCSFSFYLCQNTAP